MTNYQKSSQLILINYFRGFNIKSIDNVLEALFNEAARNPLGAKVIYLSNEKGLVDCRSINTTTNNNGSRIPSEKIISAINTLQRCYNELGQMEAFLFMYLYGACDNFLPQLVSGVGVLAAVDESIAQHSIKGYRDGHQPLAELVKLVKLEYKQVDYQCSKVRKACAILHQNIHIMVEDVLIKEKLLN